MKAWLWGLGLLIVGSLGFAGAEAGTLSGELQVDGKRPPKSFIIYLSPAGSGAADPSGDAVRISQRGSHFSPGEAVVVQGGAVDFANDEEQNIDHNVYSLSKGNRFDIGLASKGTNKRVVFKKSGIVKYFCSVHKNMEGKLFIVPSPYFAHIDKPGAFSIENVPEGEWVVKVSVAHRRYKASPVPVTIAGDGVGDVVVLVSKKRKKK